MGKPFKPVPQELLDRCRISVAEIDSEDALELIRVIMRAKAPSEEWRLYGRNDLDSKQRR